MRNRIAELAGIPAVDIVTCSQVHGSKVVTALGQDRGKCFAGADGIVTREKNLPVAVFTADCMPVFMYDRVKGVLGLLHAGWKGTEQGIVKKAAGIFIGKFFSRPEDIEVFLGPCICRNCHGYDLAGKNTSQLVSAGVKRITVSGICTCEDARLFSYKREGGIKSRMMSLLMMG